MLQYGFLKSLKSSHYSPSVVARVALRGADLEYTERFADAVRTAAVGRDTGNCPVAILKRVSRARSACLLCSALISIDGTLRCKASTAKRSAQSRNS